MRVLVCGDRHYTDEARVHEALSALDRIDGIDVIIEGCASGADSFGASWARQAGKPLRHFPPEWSKYGRAAGPKRNHDMLVEGRPDLILAFHDNLAESRGTADMVRQARRVHLPVRVYSRDGVELLRDQL